MKTGQIVIVMNRGVYEVGAVLSSYYQKGIKNYDVVLERGVILSFLTTNSDKNCYINQKYSRKFVKKIKTNVLELLKKIKNDDRESFEYFNTEKAD
jgi:hypothetical protein